MEFTQLVEHGSSAEHSRLLHELCGKEGLASTPYVIQNNVSVRLKDGTSAVLLRKGQGRSLLSWICATFCLPKFQLLLKRRFNISVLYPPFRSENVPNLIFVMPDVSAKTRATVLQYFDVTISSVTSKRISYFNNIEKEPEGHLSVPAHWPLLF